MAGWTALTLGGLVLLDARQAGTVSTRAFLATVGILGVFLVGRTVTTATTVIPPAPPLLRWTRRRDDRRRVRAPGAARIAGALRHERSRQRLAAQLVELNARRAPGRTVPPGPALRALRDGAGPADPELLAAALSEMEQRP
jgi:hypothetical protein